MFKTFNYLLLFNFLVLTPVFGMAFEEADNIPVERQVIASPREDLSMIDHWGSSYAHYHELSKPKVDLDLLPEIKAIGKFVKDMETYFDSSLRPSLKLLKNNGKKGLHHLWSEKDGEGLEQVLRKRFQKIMLCFAKTHRKHSFSSASKRSSEYLDDTYRDDYPFRVLQVMLEDHLEVAFLASDLLLKKFNASFDNEEEMRQLNASPIESLSQFMKDLDEFRRIILFTKPASYEILDPSVWQKRDLLTVDSKGIFAMIDRLLPADVNLLSESAKQFIRKEKRHRENLEDKIQGLEQFSQRLRGLEEAEASKENSSSQFSPFKFLKSKKARPYAGRTE